MKENKPYPISHEADGVCMNVAEPAIAMSVATEQAMPENIPYACIENGMLQATPDLEEEIAAADRGEVVAMGEFKTMFAQWL